MTVRVPLINYVTDATVIVFSSPETVMLRRARLLVNGFARRQSDSSDLDV